MNWHDSTVWCIDISKDNRTIISVSSDKKINVFFSNKINNQ